jgi:hypothetical protein
MSATASVRGGCRQNWGTHVQDSSARARRGQHPGGHGRRGPGRGGRAICAAVAARGRFADGHARPLRGLRLPRPRHPHGDGHVAVRDPCDPQVLRRPDRGQPDRQRPRQKAPGRPAHRLLGTARFPARHAHRRERGRGGGAGPDLLSQRRDGADPAGRPGHLALPVLLFHQPVRPWRRVGHRERLGHQHRRLGGRSGRPPGGHLHSPRQRAPAVPGPVRYPGRPVQCHDPADRA